jgi:hypothetical protein
MKQIKKGDWKMNEQLSRLRNANIGNLEMKLSQLIKPVMPDVDFVNSLKNKITNVPTIFVESTKKNTKLVAVGVGVLVSAIIVWLIKKFTSRQREE